MTTFREDPRAFFGLAHDATGILRKYTGEPYRVHPQAVAALVATVTPDPVLRAVALGHDYGEDVIPLGLGYTWEAVRELFGPEVEQGIRYLTDVYTAEDYPTLNRKARKAAEAARLATIPPTLKVVKLADLIDNTFSIVEHDPKFAKVYLAEKAVLVEALLAGETYLPLLHLGARAGLQLELAARGDLIDPRGNPRPS